VAETPPFLIVVVGPTAVGKSALAAHLARRFGGEVIGVDSGQVYQGLDAATDKPPAALRSEIPHHLVDVADPRRDFSAGDFVRLAARAIDEIHGRRRRAVLAGGTGLYLRALLRGLAEMPPRHAGLRAALAIWERRRGEGSLHRMLTALDPAAAERLSPRDRQRIVRALEVALVAGRPLSRLVAESPFGEDRYRSVKIGLTAPWEILKPRIEARVGRFFALGLVEEVRRLIASGVPRSANCFKALGYREVLQHIDGARGLPETMTLVKANTRRYAKRQMTWFRREPDVIWFAVGEHPMERSDAIDEIVARRLGAGEI